MKRIVTIATAALMLVACGTQNESEKVNIEKQTVKLESDQMTPEALWAMSRIGGYQASPDGSTSSSRWATTAWRRTRATRCSG